MLNNKGRVIGQREIRPSGQVPVNIAKQSSLRAAASISTTRPVNTVAPKSKVNDALTNTYSYFKAHSPVRRAFNQKSAAKIYNLNEKVKTARVNNVTTVGPKAVFSAAVGYGENAVKSSAYYQEVDGGFVAFGGSPKGGKITRKGKIRTGKLDFEDVYFVKELKREKANTKPLVRPSLNAYSQPLPMLHMDTYLGNICKEYQSTRYCLVVTDDYSRFSWVFFLATKDETSGILKTFITGIENQINHKVKIIRCDNGTEFKNNDMNQFYGMKWIKREFSVARTLQQNGVAERKNRTLIEAAMTMLADSLLPTTFWAKAVSTACYV
ncbi:putative ribonuclease H-like domain-containing protein [Tanacetum coccineum]